MTFAQLAIYFQKLEETTSRLKMTEILADLFNKVGGDEIGKICYLLTGRVVPLYEAREFGIADKLMIRAIARAREVEGVKVYQEFKSQGDLGKAAQNIMGSGKGWKDKRLDITEVYDQLYALTEMSGSGSQEKKIEILVNLLRSLDALSARYLVRIPLDKLRLGFSEMTILDALSWMLVGDKSLRVKLEDAYNVRPDIGFVALTVKDKGLKGLSAVKTKIGVPILASLCQRLPTADEMIKKMGRVAVEPKYDGVRCQIHYTKSKVDTFSRNLENTTFMFPELEHLDKQIGHHEVIMDSEAVGMDPRTGKLIPFQETMTRKRKYEIEKARGSVPLKFFVFDILYLDGEDLLEKPLSLRRKLLEKIIRGGETLVVSPQIVTDEPEMIRRFHDEQLKKGLEGVVVKKWESPYEPGRRGYSWVKFKQDEGKTGKLTDTIDAVIMGYDRGEGKRSSFGIGAFLVGLLRQDRFVTLTKIGTGVSDELWQELQRNLRKLQVEKQPTEYLEVDKSLTPDVWIRPEVVVEIAGDDLTKSPTHSAVYAVRFPRLVRIRTDKSAQQVTTVEELKTMFQRQKNINK